ncbi:hypothetical protein OF83DRAFT_1178264 [Amylostereum chailletii]|nr:hypothetical protein OF83DRAFT_1178264 [Amylostereum chailletii]
MALVVLYYDHIITLPNEISRIWPRFGSRSRPAFLFFLNRYVPFFGYIAVSAFSFTNLASSEQRQAAFSNGNPCSNPVDSCMDYGLARQLLLLCNQVVVSILLALRIIALYNHSRRVNIIVATFGVALFGLACWSLVGQHSSVIHDVIGCHISMTLETGIHVAVAWEAQAAFDLLIFGLTIHRTLRSQFDNCRRRRLRTPSGGLGLVDLMFRDGAIYFIVMALANISNILTFYFASPALKGVLSTFASCISITMMSRLMLNLHEAASSHRAFAGTSGVVSIHMMFASEFNSHSESGDEDTRNIGTWGTRPDCDAILPPALAARPQTRRSMRSGQVFSGDVELENMDFARVDAASRLSWARSKW